MHFIVLLSRIADLKKSAVLKPVQPLSYKSLNPTQIGLNSAVDVVWPVRIMVNIDLLEIALLNPAACRSLTQRMQRAEQHRQIH